MYQNQIYQIEEQSDLQLVVKSVTLETATDVTYSKDDIIELFGGGSFVDWGDRVREDTVLFQTHSTGNWNEERTVYMVFLQAIIRAVQKELNRNPKATVELDLGSDYISRLCQINRVFKKNGFMLRPKFGHFVKYKEPKSKSKSKKVSGHLLNEMRSIIANRVMYVLNDRLGGEFSIDNNKNKSVQIGAVRLAKIVGIKLDDVMIFAGAYYGNLYEYIKDTCKNEPELAEQAIQAIKDWWKENWTTKFEPPK